MRRLTRKQRLARTILGLIAIVALIIVTTSLWYIEGRGYCLGTFAGCHA
jgi:hypothetical protein